MKNSNFKEDHELKMLFDMLFSVYGNRNWWPAKTPYEMMVGAILTQNTTWRSVEKVIEGFGPNLHPQFVLGADHNELAEIIRASGFFNQKAIKLRALTRWFEKYAFDIEKAAEIEGEKLRQELLSVKGVGPETADSILLYACHKPYFVVDAYTRRIFSRMGFEVPLKYDDFRLRIEAALPKDVALFNEFHALIVEHAKQYCRKKPLCEDCPLKASCRQRLL